MKRIALSLLAIACLLAAPTVAAAAEYTVDDTGDEADALVGTAGCLTLGGKCTLRAAIQESNNSTGVKDTIKFKSPNFNGGGTSTIALGAGFPVITDPVTIDGDGAGQCLTAAGVNGPCVGVSGPSGGFGLVVEDDGVTIEGLAVTGALIGIDVINASEEFVARDNWGRRQTRRHRGRQQHRALPRSELEQSGDRWHGGDGSQRLRRQQPRGPRHRGGERRRRPGQLLRRDAGRSHRPGERKGHRGHRFDLWRRLQSD